MDTKPIKWLQNHGIVVVYLGVMLLILLEVLPFVTISISWQTIALITILLISPFMGNLKKIWVSNVGGVELESDIESTQRVVSKFLSESPDIQTHQSESDESSGHKEDVPNEDEPDPDEYISSLGGTPGEISNELYRLLENDPRLALAKLRMEMDETVDRFLEVMGFRSDMTAQDRYRNLSEIESLDREVLYSYKNARNLCNKAIHGEDIKMGDAIEIVDIGIDFLAGMQSRTVYERFKRGEELDDEDLQRLAEGMGKHP